MTQHLRIPTSSQAAVMNDLIGSQGDGRRRRETGRMGGDGGQCVEGYLVEDMKEVGAGIRTGLGVPRRAQDE
ncbi:unnamed protein product [Ilex paraguariensis]|uniref:Uncharacterized protein n=1 Tax=Ilex paraguariensis TaxID=185542 RepID=A0ABC8RSW5_9AQUA